MQYYWLIVVLLFFMTLGCAAPARQVSSDQVISQIQTKGQKDNLQEKLMMQGAQASSATSYKDYAVGPEDLLEVAFFGQDDLNRDVRVNGQGEVSLPLVGVVQVAGLSPQKIETRLKEMYREAKFIRNPQITVFVKEYRHQRVMITGAVKSPGSYEVIGPRTLLEMLGKSGGIDDKAGGMVHVIRYQGRTNHNQAKEVAGDQSFSPGSETIVIEIRRLLDGEPGLNLKIMNGDVIHVPYARVAYVLGAVKKPGQVPIKEKLTVAQALALTEGLDPMLASNDVNIVRLDNNGERLTIPVNLGSITTGASPDVPLQENDIVFVNESLLKRFLYNIRNLNPGSIGISAGLVP